MIKYSDDPNIGGKVVKTVTGKLEYKANCRKIKDAYHILGEDCHFVNNTWYRVESGMIVKNYTTDKWILKSEAKNLVNGVVGMDKDNFVLGYFQPNPIENVEVQDSNTGARYMAMNLAVIPNSIEHISTGLYLVNSGASVALDARKIRNCMDNKNKGYNIEDNADEYSSKVKVFNAYKLPINRDVAKYSKLLGDITFGLELECIRGYLPNNIQYQTGTVVCRDGSLHDADGSQGPEFTTIPLTGAKGVQAVINLCKELTKRTHIDKHCSLHVHIGNVPTSRLFLVSLYKLGTMIQDELFSIFPYYKNDEREYAGKDKNYCQKLQVIQKNSLKHMDKEYYTPYVNDGYYRIFNFLSGGKAFPCKNINRTNKHHPKQHKWERHARYYWLNLMNTIFSTRNTVEFRLHSGTTNAQKSITWLFICNAIVKTAIARSGDILSGKKLTLNDVLSYYLNSKTSAGIEMYEYLFEFVRLRKEYFLNDFKKGDYMSPAEITEDKGFHYTINNVSQIF